MELIVSTKHTERECRKLLHFAKELLFREDVLKEIVYIEPEVRGSSGISDYLISGTIGNSPVSDNCVRAYVWELKAPQCFLFKKDNENRLCPTSDLIHAENQLLYYYDELKGNATLRARFGITHPEYVRIGGIIIGCWSNLVKGDFEPAKKAKLYEEALRIRNEYFYTRAGIELTTWSDVLGNIGGTYRDIIKENTIPDYPFQTPTIPPGTVSEFDSVQSTKS